MRSKLIISAAIAAAFSVSAQAAITDYVPAFVSDTASKIFVDPTDTAQTKVFAEIGLAPVAAAKGLYNYADGDTSYITLMGGFIGKERYDLGAYFGLGSTPFFSSGSGESSAYKYHFNILNGGVTFNALDNLTVFSGVGFSMQDIKGKDYWGNTISSDEAHYSLNLNAGAMYHVKDGYGATVAFDSAASAISFGVSYAM